MKLNLSWIIEITQHSSKINFKLHGKYQDTKLWNHIKSIQNLYSLIYSENTRVNSTVSSRYVIEVTVLKWSIIIYHADKCNINTVSPSDVGLKER